MLASVTVARWLLLSSSVRNVCGFAGSYAKLDRIEIDSRHVARVANALGKKHRDISAPAANI